MNLRSNELLKQLADEIPDIFPIDTYSLTVLVNRIYLGAPYTWGRDLEIRNNMFVRIVSDLSESNDCWRWATVIVGLNTTDAEPDDYSVLVKWSLEENQIPAYQVRFSLREYEGGLVYGYVNPTNENWREETLACLNKILKS